MTMSENEIYDLYLQMKKKKIKQREIARHLNVSDVWISTFFALKADMSEQHIKLMKEYIASK